MSPPLEDLPDDRRAGKPGLPADDRDVTNGLVVPDEYWGKPWCVRHGAMNRIDPVEQLWRCSMCGVGARFIEAEHVRIAEGALEVDTEAGEHDIVYEPGRWGRAARNENIEKMLRIFEVTDTDPAYLAVDEFPGYRFTLHFEINIKAHWSEQFIYPDGVLDAKQGFEDDPVGFAIDAFLEPRYDDDFTEVVKMGTWVEYHPEEDAQPDPE